MNTDQPTPCCNDSRWLTTDPNDVAEAINGCLGCPALFRPHDAFAGRSCTQARLDLIANDYQFAEFAGVMAAEVHDPLADRRARRAANAPVIRGGANNFIEANRRRREATHCKRGHEFAPANTYVDPKGARNCRTCIRQKDTERRARNAETSNNQPTTSRDNAA